MHTDHRLSHGEEHFQAGEFAEAETLFREVLTDSPENADAWNNLAAIAAGKGHFEIAYDHLSRALALCPSHQQARDNFRDVCEMLGIPGAARRIAAAADRLTQATSVAESAPMRVALCCIPGDDSNLEEIVTFLRPTTAVRTCVSTDGGEIAEAVSWANVVWLEGATQMAENLTRMPDVLRNKVVVCRFLGEDLFSESVNRIAWRLIDHVVVPTARLRMQLYERVSLLKTQQTPILVIPHGIDSRTVPYHERKPGKNLAFIGDITFHKGPLLLLHAFAELRKVNPSYELHIIGSLFDDRYPLYFTQMASELQLREAIHFGALPKDLGQWFKDKNYIIGSSLIETNLKPVLTAMVGGMKPVIHNFVGARGMLDAKYLWNTVPEFIAHVTSAEYDSAEYRRTAEWQFDIQILRFKLDKLMGTIEAALNPAVRAQTRTTPNTEVPASIGRQH